MQKKTSDIIDEKIKAIRQIIPECFSEGNLNIDEFYQIIGNVVGAGEERYSLNWNGKNNAKKNRNAPSNATLVPVKNKSVNFDNTGNIFIEGDNLEVLKLLRKSYYEKIKMIYIDPPYNTGNDFIYKDNYHNSIESYLKQTGQTKDGITLTTNTETSGRFHSDWMSFMYPRLSLARYLLTDDGIIFISIDDNEIHNLRFMLDEIFGPENFIANIVWQKVYSPKNQSKRISNDHEYIICYARNIHNVDFDLLPRTEKMNNAYKNPDNDSRGLWKSGDLMANEERVNGHYNVKSPSGKIFDAPQGKHWAVSQNNMEELIKDNRIWFGQKGDAIPSQKQFLHEVQQGRKSSTLFFHQDAGHTDEAKKELIKFFGQSKYLFPTPKPTRLIKQLLYLASVKNEIVLDFFAGSGTTADAIMDLNKKDGGNRKFILVQIPETIESTDSEFSTISNLCVERIARVIKKLTTGINSKQDLGFKVFKMAKSNYKEWKIFEENDEEKLKKQMKLLQFPLIDDFEIENVIYEYIIKEGFDLNCKIKKIKTKINKIFCVSNYNQSEFYITLDKSVSSKIIEELKLKKDDKLICIDTALDDSLKANLLKQCELETI